MPLDPKDTSGDIRELYKTNVKRKQEGQKPRSRAQIIAIALNATGKSKKS